MNYNPNKKQKIALIGVWILLLIGILEAYFKDYLNTIPIIYPITISAMLFSLGYAVIGTIKGGLLASVWFLALMIMAVLATLISTNPILLIPLILIIIGALIFYVPVIKAATREQKNTHRASNKFDPKILIILFLIVAGLPFLKLLIVIIKKLFETL